jgi:putative ABC transport system permease protein
VLLAAVAVVLLVACANVAALLLARAADRRKEIAIRAALGAGRVRIVRQLLVESVLVSLLAGALGVLLATWGVAALVAATPIEVPRLEDVGVDSAVLGFTVLVSIGTGLVFGLAPALSLARTAPGESLQERGGPPARSLRTRQVLVAAEVALSVVLLTAAALLIRSFAALRQVDPGFVAERGLAIGLTLPDARYPDDASRVAFFRRLLDEAARLPGAVSYAITTTVPMTGSELATSFTVEGAPPPSESERPIAAAYAVSTGYFATMGIPILYGRAFEPADNEDRAGVAIVSESLARRFWPGEAVASVIGKRLTLPYGSRGAREIIGIAGDVKQRELAESARPQLYTPFAQAPWPFMTLVVRTAGDPAAVASSLRLAVSRLDPDQSPGDVEPLDRYLDRSVATPRFTALVAGCFAGLALLLAGSGLYALTARAVAQRRRELGIRMALGADPAAVRRLVVRQALVLGAIGLAAGLTVARAAGGVIAALLFGVGPADPVAIASGAALLAVVLLAAAYVPARRATRASPMALLHSD